MHPNAEFAIKLKAWTETKVDHDDVVAEAQKRGFLTPVDGELSLTTTGEKFISKWTAGKPSSTYERKPIEIHNEPRRPSRNEGFDSRSSRHSGFSRPRSDFGDQTRRDFGEDNFQRPSQFRNRDY